MGIVFNHRCCCFQNILSGPIVLLQPNHFGTGVIFFEVQNIADIGTTPTVYRLILITHNNYVLVFTGQQPHHFILAAIRILVFVNHQISNHPIVGRTQIPVVFQQPDSFVQKIVKIQGIGLTQTRFVLFVDHCQPLHFRIAGLLVPVLRSSLRIFGLADARQRGAILHERFVQSDGLEDRPHQRKLIIIVVNVEGAGEVGTDIGQPVAITSQHTH